MMPHVSAPAAPASGIERPAPTRGGREGRELALPVIIPGGPD